MAEAAPTAGARALRADARRNRARLRQAAEEVFAEEGVGAPVDEIARRAGVGVGTLYRHYPTKEQLIEDILVDRFEQMVADAHALTDAADPTEAFFAFLDRMFQQSLAKRDFADVLARAGIDVTAGRRDLFEAAMRVGDQLLARAQAAGGVRPDVSMADLCYLLSGACSAAVAPAGPVPLRSSPEHLLDVIRAGLRPPTSEAPGPR